MSIQPLRTPSRDQLVEWAEQIIEAHRVGAEADAGFDGGEFSGAAHDRLEEKALTKLAEAHDLTYDELMHSVYSARGEYAE